MQAEEDSFENAHQEQNATEADEYSDMLNAFQATLNGTGQLDEFGCGDVPDCIILSMDHLTDLWSDVSLPQFEYLYENNAMMSNYSKQLASGNLTLSEAYEIVQEVVDWVNATMDEEVWCGEAPSITLDPLPLATTFPGRSLELQCDAVALPEPAVYWYKVSGREDDELVATGRRLTLTDIVVEDDGQYYCLAQNHIANVTSNSSQVLVVAGSSSELVLQYSFAGENHTQEVLETNSTASFRIAARVEVSTKLGVEPERNAHRRKLTLSTSAKDSAQSWARW